MSFYAEAFVAQNSGMFEDEEIYLLEAEEEESDGQQRVMIESLRTDETLLRVEDELYEAVEAVGAVVDC